MEFNQPLWQKVFERLEISPKAYPRGIQANLTADHEPVIGFVIDRPTHKTVIEDTTILIPHWESLGFIELCLHSIRSVFDNESKPSILVIDDKSSLDTYSELQRICDSYSANLLRIERDDHSKTADVGAVLDFGISKTVTKFICMLDADTMILDRNFLLRPISLLEKLNCVSVGLDTGLADSYHAQPIWTRNTEKREGLNFPGETSITNNLYRVMRTADARAIAKAIGFSRKAKERKFRDQIGRSIRKLDTLYASKLKISGFSKELIKKSIFNSKYPNMPPTSDNGVNANYWMDTNSMGWKYNLPITSFGFKTPNDGICFQNISGSLVHIALSTRALSKSRREIPDAGNDFYEGVKLIVSRSQDLNSLSEKVLKLSLRNNN
jgi:hypothetical protein